MKPFIVVADGLDKTLFASLQEIADFNVHPHPKLTPEELAELQGEMEGLVIRSATTVTKDLLDNCPKLKYIIRAGEGTDNIDKAACALKGVKVANTPGANNNSAAEHAISLMMTVLRKTAWAHSSMQAGKWEKPLFVGNELANKTVGIVGLGRIGQILAKRISGFDPKILFYDPFIEAGLFPEFSRKENLEDIFKSSDIVTIHMPLMDATRNIIDKKLLDCMKPDAILINCARGGLVDEKALYETLKGKKIRGAGFDVFQTEPLPPEGPLRTLDNLVLTPHLGASTTEAQERVAEMAIHQLKEFFLNHNLLNEVKK